MPFNPIFSDNLLTHYLLDFQLSSVTNMRGITLKLEGLIDELESGKIENSKEEEIKPRFINTFFGDILGFNYGNADKWQLRDEKKTVIDGTKPDAALGYFFVDRSNDDVRIVIEIKDAKTDLDEKQSSYNQKTPVEQAFEYAPKMGGKCSWVIVSNIKEIRFYPSLDRSKCQVFYLKDLLNESKLKELLFLFHKDRFIKEKDKSSTDKLFENAKAIELKNDKPLHVIEKIYKSLKRFEGFGFVDPHYIATIFPFNILNEHVWQYEDRNLLTINPEIYELLSNIIIENKEIKFTEKLQKEIADSKILDAKYKLEWTFSFLNRCLIEEISAVKDYNLVAQRNKKTINFSYRVHFSFKEGEEGIRKNIKINDVKSCDCLSCNYRSLNFDKFLSKLKVGIGNETFNTLEYAYGNYLVATNNFKTSYSIYKSIEKELKGKQDKGIQYFLTKQNIKLLHNLALDYQMKDSKEIMSDIKSVDLDKVIYDEIEFDIDKEVKNYLISVKEETLIYKLQDEIEELTFEIEKLKTLYKDGGKQEFGPNLPNNLAQKYHLLYLHINANYIIYDIFKRYKSLAEKVFKGLIATHQISDLGFKSFNHFFLTEAILHVRQDYLQEILKNVNVIKTDNNSIEILLTNLNSFITSYFKDGFFSEVHKNPLLIEQLNNYKFKDRFTSIFANLFTILSRLDISKEQFDNCRKPLLKFLKIEDDLAWFDLKEFSNFLIKKGHLFELTDLTEIFRIAITRDKYGYHKYTDLIDDFPKVLVKFYPDYKVDNTQLINIAISKCTSDEGKNSNYVHLIPLASICDDNCKKILFNTFEQYLDGKFNGNFYEILIRDSEYDYNAKSYFQLYSEYTNQHKGGRAYKHGANELTDLIFINYILVVYKCQIDFDRKEFKVFTNLNEFETWLLNPIKFDYEMFDAKWLIDISHTIIIDRLKGNNNIGNALEAELKKEFNSTLAELKYKYF